MPTPSRNLSLAPTCYRLGCRKVVMWSGVHNGRRVFACEESELPKGSTGKMYRDPFSLEWRAR